MTASPCVAVSKGFVRPIKPLADILNSRFILSFLVSINKLQDRGKFFVDPNDEIYAGQVIGESTRQDDLIVNLTKTKQLTNMRKSGTDDKMTIAPAVKFTLEESMEYIGGDEYVEVTPKAIRLRKIMLSEHDRKRKRNAESKQN